MRDVTRIFFSHGQRLLLLLGFPLPTATITAQFAVVVGNGRDKWEKPTVSKNRRPWLP